MKSAAPSPTPDDPQGLLYLAGRYLEHLRVRNFSSDTLYGRGLAKGSVLVIDNLGKEFQATAWPDDCACSIPERSTMS